ncbi:MAG TPA: hypothetical protein VGP48_13665 [Stellaceae bacterium]|jgi:hypothetical protein|nr:hypothetical protein [Stellaceae bacterium]
MGKRFGCLIVALATAGTLIAGAGSAQASMILYNSFGTGSTNCRCFSPQAKGPDVSGTFLGTNNNWIAGSFTPSVTDHLYQLKLALGSGGGPDLNEGTSGGYPGAVVLLLPDDGSGHPDTTGSGASEVWVDSKIPVSIDKQKPTTFTSKLLPTLTVGTTYWIVVEPISTDSNIIWWSSPTVSQAVENTDDGGVTWTGYTGKQAAFEVLGQ